MSYVITKIIDKRFIYYLGNEMRWEGLISNALEFHKRMIAMDYVRKVRRYFPNEEIKITKNIEGDK